MTFPEQLRFWRKHKNFSQLDLALESGVSSKHISFVETGRSKPSKQMVLTLCDVLNLPLRNRNELLSAAGFADQYKRTPIEKDEMVRLRETLDIILEKQEPYPLTVLDWDWNIIQKNKAFDWIYKTTKTQYPDLIDSLNIAELVFAPNGFKPFLRNWEEVAITTIRRLQFEQQESPGRHFELLKKIKQYPGVAELELSVYLDKPTEPVIYVHFVVGDHTLKFLTTLTSFGTPIDVTASELLIESYYPADDETREFLENEVGKRGRI